MNYATRIDEPAIPAGLTLLALDRDAIDDDVGGGAIAIGGRRAADLPHDIHPFNHLAENGMAVVKMRRRRQRDEELAAVGVRAAVGHRQDAGLVVPQLRMKLVAERVSRSADPL